MVETARRRGDVLQGRLSARLCGRPRVRRGPDRRRQARLPRHEAARHREHGLEGRRERGAARRDVPHRACLSADHERRGRGAAGLRPEGARRDGAHLLRRHRSRARPATAPASTRWSRAARSRRTISASTGSSARPRKPRRCASRSATTCCSSRPASARSAAAHGDQKRVATPTQAIDAGADYLVVGPADHRGEPIRRRPRRRSSPKSPRRQIGNQSSEEEDACRRATGSGASM